MKGKRGLRAGALLCVAALGCALGAGCSGGEVAEPVYEDNKALHIGAWVAPPPAMKLTVSSTVLVLTTGSTT